MFDSSMMQKSWFHIKLLIITIIIFESLFACLASPKTIVDFLEPKNPAFDSSFSLWVYPDEQIVESNGLGDINGDGFDDFFVSLGTEVFIVYGSANFQYDSLATDIRESGFKITADDTLFFNSVSSAGDINNDGITDIIIGTSSSISSKYLSSGIFVIYGKRGGNSDIHLSFFESSHYGFRILTETTNNVSSIFEESWVCSTGDINGDKVDDILLRVGDPPGSLYAVYGNASRVDDDVNLAALTPNQGMQIVPIFPGHSTEPMSGIGDVNHDGIDDFAVKYYGVDGIPQQIYVIYGRSSVSSGVLVFPSNSLGFRIKWHGSIVSVGSAGDLNADGIDDFAVSVLNDADTLIQEPYGAVYIIYGKMNNFTNIDLDAFNDSMGFKIRGSSRNIIDTKAFSALGDVNNDGFDDFLLATREQSDQLALKAFIIFGQKDRRPNINLATSENLLLTLIGNSFMHVYFSIALKARDLNNDGYNDIAIGWDLSIYGLLGSNCNEYTDCNFPMPTICYASKGGDCIKKGMMVQDLACVSSCSSGYYQAPDHTCRICSANCKKCSSNPVCETCFEGYLMQDSLCVSSCSIGYTQYGTICSCSPGYYQESNSTCKSCSANCIACSNGSVCETCLNGYLMENSLCVASCSTGYTLNGSICEPSAIPDRNNANNTNNTNYTTYKNYANETPDTQSVIILIGSAAGVIVVISVLIAGSCYLKREKNPLQVPPSN